MSEHTKEAELLPCPFCGGDKPYPDEVLRDGCRKGEPDAFAHFIACNSCAAEGGWAKTPGNAVRNWNNRRTPAPGAEPVADALRLDWLEKVGTFDVTMGLDGRVIIDDDETEDEPVSYPTLHAAIDAARASTPIASPADTEATNEHPHP